MRLIPSWLIIFRVREVIFHEFLSLKYLNKEDAIHLNRIISKYSDLCRLLDEPIGYTDIIAYKIVTTNDRSINSKQYTFPPIHKDKINKQVKDEYEYELIMKDIIKPSDSPYNSFVWVISKKSDSQNNKKSIVIDFRALNKKAIGEAYSLSNITQILEAQNILASHIFDVALGFHQIPMHKSDAQETIFSLHTSIVISIECHSD